MINSGELIQIWCEEHNYDVPEYKSFGKPLHVQYVKVRDWTNEEPRAVIIVVARGMLSIEENLPNIFERHIIGLLTDPDIFDKLESKLGKLGVYPKP